MSPRYTTGAVMLHWAIATLILVNLSVGFFMEGFPRPQKELALWLHFSCGMTVLALTVVRVGWRLAHRPPVFPEQMSGWERVLAHTAHGLLYVAMLALPLTGWAIVSCHPPRPGGVTQIWGLFSLPPIGPLSKLGAVAQRSRHDQLVQMHALLAWSQLVLLALHVLGAVKHQILDGQPVLARMGINLPGPPCAAARVLRQWALRVRSCRS